ncbi:hypothetical protein [Glacieibacterium frigidum]|uniref:Uncharacterized protein n=1 Tax=Glacieibacterium frigidum TaxID=2593303 RepID=A0A552U8G1_9SPHN|nr:hypothetical protein [Glacieibacterium frigidum]TRW14508.1 hypothetical protein FMM06_12445 [Glacieibacterium frigidum]
MQKLIERLVEVAPMPTDLSTSLETVLRNQAAWYSHPQIERHRGFHDVFLNPTTSGLCYRVDHDPSDPFVWPTVVTPASVKAWLWSNLPTEYGWFALKQFTELLCLDDIDDEDATSIDGNKTYLCEDVGDRKPPQDASLVASLVNLASHSRPLFDELTIGDVRSAYRMVPDQGFPAVNGQDAMPFVSLRSMCCEASKYRSAGDVLRTAEGQHRILRGPTGHNELDRCDPHSDVKIDGVTGKLGAAFVAFREVGDIFLRRNGREVPDSFPGLEKIEPRRKFKSRAAEDRYMSDLGLTVLAKVMEKLWRIKEGANFEKSLNRAMAQGSYELQRQWRHTKFRRRPRNRNVHMANARGSRPKMVVFLACNAGVSRNADYHGSLVAKFNATNSFEQAFDACRAGRQVSFAAMRDEGMRKGLDANELCPPRIHKDNRLQARELFSLLSRTVLRSHIDAPVQDRNAPGWDDHPYEEWHWEKGQLRDKEKFVCEVTESSIAFYRRYHAHQPNRHEIATVRAALGPTELQLRGLVKPLQGNTLRTGKADKPSKAPKASGQ